MYAPFLWNQLSRRGIRQLAEACHGRSLAAASQPRLIKLQHKIKSYQNREDVYDLGMHDEHRLGVVVRYGSFTLQQCFRCCSNLCKYQKVKALSKLC